MCGALPERSPHPLVVSNARALRVPSGNGIGAKGAKELAAALKDNTTLTELFLGACSGALPTHGTALAHTRTCGGRVAVPHTHGFCTSCRRR